MATAKAGAGVDAEDAGIRQRVPRDGLDERPGDPEREASGEADEGARDAEVEDHDELGRVARPSGEGVDDRAERDVARSDRDARERREHEHAERQQQARRARRSAPCPALGGVGGGGAREDPERHGPVSLPCP